MSWCPKTQLILVICQSCVELILEHLVKHQRKTERSGFWWLWELPGFQHSWLRRLLRPAMQWPPSLVFWEEKRTLWICKTQENYPNSINSQETENHSTFSRAVKYPWFGMMWRASIVRVKLQICHTISLAYVFVGGKMEEYGLEKAKAK